MRSKLAYERKLKYCNRVREIYYESYHFARTHEAHLAKMNQLVWMNPEYRKCPAYVRDAVATTDSLMFDSLYEWRYENKAPLAAISIGPDGRMFGEKDDSWLSENAEYKSAMKCSHVWRHKWDSNEFKPWS